MKAVCGDRSRPRYRRGSWSSGPDPTSRSTTITAGASANGSLNCHDMAAFARALPCPHHAAIGKIGKQHPAALFDADTARCEIRFINAPPLSEQLSRRIPARNMANIMKKAPRTRGLPASISDRSVPGGSCRSANQIGHQLFGRIAILAGSAIAASLARLGDQLIQQRTPVRFFDRNRRVRPEPKRRSP